MKKKILFSLSVVFIAVILFASYFYIDSSYKVKSITVDGVAELNGAYALQNANILFLNTQKAQDSLLKRNPLVKKIDISKKLPNTLTIMAQMSTPFTYLKIEQGYGVLSMEGKILSFVDRASGMPIIEYYQQFKQEELPLGDTLNYKDVQTSLFFLEKMARLGFVIETVDINSLNVILFKSGEKQYFFSVEKDKDLQYQTLKTILEYFKKENKDYKSIDLRFDKPVIRI
jgi:hypothetical protein